MADNSVVQTIKDAEIDARSLSEFIYKPADFMVTRRLAPPIHTLDYYISTVAEVTSKVVADSGAFDSVIVAANSKLDNAVAAAESKVGYIESTVQNAINNTAVEGGILADTFVTVTKKTQKAIARTQAQVNGERVSVKDYGAVGDGVADDTQAFRDAIADALPHTTIYMPKGIYRLTNTLTWKTKLSLIGDGIGSSVLNMDGELFSAIDASIGRPSTGLNPDGSAFSDPLEYCRFEDFEIDGSGLTYPDAHVGGKGIFILAMKRCLFRNLYIHHTIGTGLGCDFLDETAIENCNVSYCGRNFNQPGPKIGQSGIGIGTGQKAVENVTVSNCTTNHNGNYGVFIEIQSEALRDWAPTGAKISNCYAEGNRYGFGNRLSGSAIFLGCHAYKNKEFGFYALRTKYGINMYNSCFAEANDLAGFRSERASGLDRFVNCISFNNKSHGFYITTDNINGEYIGKEGVSISSCVAYKNSGSGFVIGSTPLPSDNYTQGKHTINDSIATECAGNGVLSQNVQNLSVSACDLSSNALAGLNIGSVAKYADYSIQNNRLSKNGQQGLIAVINNEPLSFDFIANKVINNCEAATAGYRQGAKISAEKKALIQVKNNSFISTNGADKQAVGLETKATDISAAFKVIDNIFEGHELNNLVYAENTDKSIYVGNIGFNDDSRVVKSSISASPAQLPKKPFPVRYYLSSANNDIAVKKDSEAPFISNGGNVVLDVPAGVTGYTVVYGSTVSVSVQKY